MLPQFLSRWLACPKCGGTSFTKLMAYSVSITYQGPAYPEKFRRAVVPAATDLLLCGCGNSFALAETAQAVQDALIGEYEQAIEDTEAQGRAANEEREKQYALHAEQERQRKEQEEAEELARRIEWSRTQGEAAEIAQREAQEKIRAARKARVADASEVVSSKIIPNWTI